MAVFVLQLVAEIRGKHAESEAAPGGILNKLLRKIAGDIEELLEDEYDVALEAGADGDVEDSRRKGSRYEACKVAGGARHQDAVDFS